MWLVWLFTLGLFGREQISLLSSDVSAELSSRTVSRKVLSPLQSLTSVFGMGTGGPSAFVTPTRAVRQCSAIHIVELRALLRKAYCLRYSLLSKNPLILEN